MASHMKQGTIHGKNPNTGEKVCKNRGAWHHDHAYDMVSPFLEYGTAHGNMNTVPEYGIAQEAWHLHVGNGPTHAKKCSTHEKEHH